MFLDEEFLLTTPTARTLFHDYAEHQPVIDYHCHLNPSEIAEDKNFSGIVEAWLGGDDYGDHYKWRLMRANGVSEELVTGKGDDWEKFQAFAGAMEKAIGNPVYLWTHLELRRIFGIEKDLNRSTAREIFDRTNELLASPEFSRRGLIRNFNVEAVCTTDDPADDLGFHQQLAGEKDFKVLPAMRPDKALNIDRPGFGEWVTRLEGAVGHPVSGFDGLTAAIDERVGFFHEMGGRLSDHALDVVEYAEATPAELDVIVDRARSGAGLSTLEVVQYRTALIKALMRIYQAHNWTMQLHIHAARDLNSAMYAAHGADTGYDAMWDHSLVAPLAKLLDSAEADGVVPRTIIYSLNPNDWLPIASLFGRFQGGGTVQKFALGNAWWFNDTRSGIRRQLEVQAEQSLLGNFVGMTTDSRSFLSYPRHEFFRRILCELVGEWVERGEITNDIEALGTLVSDVSYGNAKKFFAF